MDQWESQIEKAIREALANADTLPGVGKPLQWDEDPNVPSDMQMAYRIMRQNNFAPAWIMQGKELEEVRQSLLQNLGRGVRAYRGALADAARKADPAQRASAELRAQSAFNLMQQKLGEAFQTYNRSITTYNLKLPPGIAHRTYLDLQEEFRKLLGR
jgi:hypothetical protein